MRKIDVKELKLLWKKFFEDKGFKWIKSASLIPENDATVLFTTAGMHPLVPYLLGEKHPQGDRLCDVQKCVRTNDIDDVGDSSHCTFFEMLGCWTLGKCNKAEMIGYSYEFLTSEEYLGIDKDRLAVSVFAGNEVAEKDTVAYNAWKNCGLRDDQIFYLPKENNWWALGGGVGPCGPDTEMFFDTGKPKCCDTCSPACDCGKYLEFWNDVFMEFNSLDANTKPVPLAKPNIDTGMGVERTVCVLNGVKSVYDVGSFKKVIDYVQDVTKVDYVGNEKPFRILADHLRASTFMLGDGVSPSNVGQGYILRRLIRRSVNYARNIGLSTGEFKNIVNIYIEEYKEFYSELEQNKETIIQKLDAEIVKFERTINQGYKEFEKVISRLQGNLIDGVSAFRLYDTFGFPFELTKELAGEKGIEVDEQGFKEAFSQHQQKSKMAGEQLFKGGLSDTSDKSAHLHTATHIMLAGLRKMFGDNVYQKGSNITPERLRFDFNLDRKMTPEEVKELENFVNDVISQKIEVVCEEMPIEKAKESGALGIFDNKYGEIVKVYTIGNVSKEMCGGPHAKNTFDLGKFKITKEESSSAGVRRIKAVLQ